MNHNNEAMPLCGILCLLFTIAIVSLVILIRYMARPITANEMLPAQDRLLTVGDWMLKASVSAILGFAGAQILPSEAARPPNHT